MSAQLEKYLETHKQIMRFVHIREMIEKTPYDGGYPVGDGYTISYVKGNSVFYRRPIESFSSVEFLDRLFEMSPTSTEDSFEDAEKIWAALCKYH